MLYMKHCNMPFHMWNNKTYFPRINFLFKATVKKVMYTRVSELKCLNEI